MAVTREQVAELYVSFFQRAPDADGLSYWVDAGLTIEQIAQSFFEQEETQAKYPDTLTDAAFIEAIYVNMFNHTPDAEGLVYWTKELADGNISRAEMILAIANGATGEDKTILDNKTEVGLHFADSGLNDVEEAKKVMEGVNADAASVVAGKANVDTAASLDLTTGKDTIVGTDADETFNAVRETYTTGDSIDGGGGEDTFILKIPVSSGLSDPKAVLTNIESVVIESANPQTISAANWSGVQHITFGNNTNTTTLSNIANEISSITLDKVTTAKAHSFAFDNGLYLGTEDALAVTLSNSTQISTLNIGPVTGTADTIEVLNITSTNNTGTTVGLDINLMDGSLTNINLTGNGDFKLVTSATVKLGMVDASALTGKFTYVSTSSVATGETIKGGSAADTITSNNVSTTIFAGAGDDIINANAGLALNHTITGGAGKDTITLRNNSGNDSLKVNYAGDTGTTTATADVVNNFKTGQDTISIAGIGAGTTANTVTVTDTSVTTVEEAMIVANTGILSGKSYVIVDNTTTVRHFLVFDHNGDGKADGVINFNTEFTYTDIA